MEYMGNNEICPTKYKKVRGKLNNNICTHCFAAGLLLRELYEAVEAVVVWHTLLPSR